MSAIAPRLQSAFLKWLLLEATRETAVSHSFALATSAENVTVHSVGQRATVETNSFTLNFYTSFGHEQVALPAVIISCTQASDTPETPGIWEADVAISVEYHADDVATEPEPHEAVESAANWIHDILCDGNYTAQGLMEAEPDLIVMGVYGVTVRSAVDGEKRTRAIQTDFKVVASI